MPNVVDLRPGSFIIHTFSNNAHTVTLTFENGYPMGNLSDWTIWVGSSPTSTHLVDITPTSLVGQVLTFTISALTTHTYATQTQSLYVAQSAEVILAPLIEFDETSSTAPTTTDVTVASSGDVDVAVSALRGIQGAQGSNGVQGARGFQGFQGVQGTAGSNGAQGVQGSTGLQGAIGSQGSQGFQGSQGSQGSQGTTGSQGFQGPADGAQGATGAQGFAGPQGSQGIAGSAYTGGQGNRSTTQIITNNSATFVSYVDADTFDTGSFHSTLDDSKFLPYLAGKWLITAAVSWSANASGQRTLQLLYNGSATGFTPVKHDASSSGSTGQQYSTVLYTPTASAINYVQLQVTQNSGSSLTITSKFTLTYLGAN